MLFGFGLWFGLFVYGREVSCFGFGVVAGVMRVLVLFITFCFAGACY